MLTNLHVKNLALIDEADVDFYPGLNILSGETGAGKSIILGSINIALGSKASPDIIRKGSDYTLTELIFSIDSDEIRHSLKELEIPDIEEDAIIISRKITPQRSKIMINGITCTNAMVQKVAALLINIHGQHDNQLLLNEASHIKLVDSFGYDTISPLKDNYSLIYKEFSQLRSKLEKNTMDEESREREISFLEFEINEINEADLKEGEDEDLEAEFKKLNNSKKIIDNISQALQVLSDSNDNCNDLLGSAIHHISNASTYDDSLSDILASLGDADDLISTSIRSLENYIDNSEMDDESLNQMSQRLDLINKLKNKYGKTIEDILAYSEEKQARLDDLVHFQEINEKLSHELDLKKDELDKAADSLSKARIKAADLLSQMVSKALSELNFLNNQFEAEFKPSQEMGPDGNDIVRFMISTNVGQPLMPLSKIASGGELSRIMLAIKTCMAGKDDIGTLIFDEIDAGISGRTAQRVAEQLAKVSVKHQIICITHLPQIASMADRHYIIEKSVNDQITSTSIYELDYEKEVDELARMIGGSSITESCMTSAKEMKEGAKNYKANCIQKMP